MTELIDALAADGHLRTTDGAVDAGVTLTAVAFRTAIVRYVRFLDEAQLALLRELGHVATASRSSLARTQSEGSLVSVECTRATAVGHPGQPAMSVASALVTRRRPSKSRTPTHSGVIRNRVMRMSAGSWPHHASPCSSPK